MAAVAAGGDRGLRDCRLSWLFLTASSALALLTSWRTHIRIELVEVLHGAGLLVIKIESKLSDLRMLMDRSVVRRID
jgi:hypothetical protein